MEVIHWEMVIEVTEDLTSKKKKKKKLHQNKSKEA